MIAVGGQLNSYTIFGKYVGLFSNTGVNYGLYYKSGEAKVPINNILSIDANTMMGVSGRVPISENASVLFGIGGALGVSYIENKTSNAKNLNIGLGAGLAQSVYFKYFNFDFTGTNAIGSKDTLGYVARPYILLSF